MTYMDSWSPLIHRMHGGDIRKARLSDMFLTTLSLENVELFQYYLLGCEERHKCHFSAGKYFRFQ